MGCVDGNDDLRLLLELQQHLHLAVRLEAGQDARGVIVVKKLAAEFQIELAAEMRDALQDPFGLQLQILLIVKSNFHSSFLVSRSGVLRRFCTILHRIYHKPKPKTLQSPNGKTRKISAPANAGRAVVYPARFVANLDFGLKKPYTISNYSGCNIRYSTKYCEESA